MKQILVQKDIEKALGIYLHAIGLQNATINSVEFTRKQNDDGLTAVIDFDAGAVAGLDVPEATVDGNPEQGDTIVRDKDVAVEKAAPKAVETKATDSKTAATTKAVAPKDPDAKPKKKLFGVKEETG